jgi:preprotein translocase subunit SecE
MKMINYIKASYTEFRDHVTWPSWATLQQDTIIVAITTLILAVFLYAVDSLFGNVVIKNIFELLR